MNVRIGVVPIVWNNADLPDLAPPVPVETVRDEVARLGYAGMQDGPGFPQRAGLRDALASRGLSLAEVYVAIACTPDGPGPGAEEAARRRLDDLDAADGDVLVAALGFSEGRQERAGRATQPGTPVLTDAGWRALGALLDSVGAEAAARGRMVAFHPHAGTFVETPDEVDRLLAATDPSFVRLCLDTGHYLVGGGDPVAAARRYGGRVGHVHVKDVAPEPLARLCAGAIPDFFGALRERIFTEAGSGLLDLAGLLDALAAAGYAGWLMVEQDTTWAPASESAAIGKRVLEFALRSRDEAAAGRLAA